VVAAVVVTERDPLKFIAGVTDKLGYYVYALIDPRTDEVFYVGKGRGNRVYQHARHAKKVTGESAEELKLGRIQAIHAVAMDVKVEIIRHGLDEATAFECEAAAMDTLKVVGLNLTNKVAGQASRRGWRPLEDVILSYAARPVTIRPADAVILVRINRRFTYDMTPDDLYEATRKWWRISPERHKPTLAFAVYNGIVREVYAVRGWERSPTSGRWAFDGEIDRKASKRYAWTDVSAYFTAGAQSPVVYVNC
jgi:hypothetical protein